MTLCIIIGSCATSSLRGLGDGVCCSDGIAPMMTEAMGINNEDNDEDDYEGEDEVEGEPEKKISCRHVKPFSQLGKSQH